MTSTLMPLRFALTPRPSPYVDDGVFEDASRTIPAIRDAVIRRDGETCRFCGFRSAKYQTVVWPEGSERDVDRILTSCVFCEQVARVDLAAVQSSGVLVWLPEISQTRLNYSMPAVYSYRISTRDERGDRARHLLDRIMARRALATERFGSDHPETVATRLRQKEATSRKDGLGPDEAAEQGLRLLPLDRRIIREGELEFNQFPQMLAFWRSRSGPLGTHLPQARMVFDELAASLASV